MSGILNSGKLATLLSRLSSARAGYLDNLTNLDATISTLLTSGGYTSARAAKLDNLDAAITAVGSTPPTAIEGVSFQSRVDQLSGFSIATASVGTVQNTWYPILTDTDSGILEFVSLYQNGTGAADYQARLLIDGVAVWTSTSNFWTGDDDTDGAVVVGGAIIDASTPAVEAMSFGAIPFTTSFSLDARCTSASTAINFSSRYRYYTT